MRLPLAKRDFVPPSPPIFVSSLQQAATTGFIVVPAGYDGGWHPSPKRQWLFFLSGTMRMETADGQVTLAGAGSIVLLEDTSGDGHYSRTIGEEPVVIASVQLS